jgi:heme exporter protein D
MDSLASFLDMGGRAAFVWPAYGITLLVLAGMLLHAMRRARLLGRELDRLEASRRRVKSRERNAP